MKPREYCCCAIPMINAGIYGTIVIQFITGTLVGVLALATPHIVGASTPGFANVLIGAICFVAAGIQVIGLAGVAREKPVLYRRYVTLHGLATTAAFSIAAAWVIISATRHSTAKAKCILNFFPNISDSTEGNTMCNIFTWVDVGIMAGLWAILAALHIYFYVVLASYGSSQQQDHKQYEQLDPAALLTGDASYAMEPVPHHGDVSASQPYNDNFEHVGENNLIGASERYDQPRAYPNEPTRWN